MPGQVIGHGSQLELGVVNAGTTTYTAIEGVTSIDFGSNKIDTVDNTDMGTTGTTRTFISGLENPGDLSAKINVVPGDTTQAALIAAKGLGVQVFKAIYPGAVRTVSFSGIITSIDESIPDDKLPTYSVKIQVTGPKTYS
jgi:predicted secreted protein